MALITCQDVTLAYEGKPVVEHLSLRVTAGDYLCVLGENGSGKSTLVKGLLGFLQPSHGTIRFGEGLQRSDIGYLPQRNLIQRDFPASVWEVVASGQRSRWPFFTKKEKQQVHAKMTQMGVEGLAKESFQQLSGGQQQRVLLARALCAAERLLLLDEPVAGLDPLATKELYQRIDSLHQQGMAIVMISHDVQAAMAYGQHILHMAHQGAFFGTREEYQASLLGQAFEGDESHG